MAPAGDIGEIQRQCAAFKSLDLLAVQQDAAAPPQHREAEENVIEPVAEPQLPAEPGAGESFRGQQAGESKGHALGFPVLRYAQQIGIGFQP